MRDLYHDLLPEISLKFLTYTAVTNGQVVIDLQGYEGALILIASGTLTDGAYTFELKHGNESDLSDGVAVPDSDLLGTEPEFALTEDDTVKSFGYVGPMRYLRIDLKAVSGITSGGVLGGMIIKGLPRHAPVV